MIPPSSNDSEQRNWIRRTEKTLKQLFRQVSGLSLDRPMNTMTVGWLIGMLEATVQNRDHGSNLEIIKSLRDAESSQLTASFTAIVGAAVTVVVSLGALLFGTITNPRETGSVSLVTGNTTTVTKTFADSGLGIVGTIVLVAMICFIVSASVLLVSIRARHSRVDRAYANALALYFFLSRQIR
jgi:hypothetical protein